VAERFELPKETTDDLPMKQEAERLQQKIDSKIQPDLQQRARPGGIATKLKNRSAR